MKNILIISQSLTGGGAEKVAANLSTELSKIYNVFIVTYKKTEMEYEHKGTRINIDCIGGKANAYRKVKNALFRISSVREIKKKYHIDCSISLVPQTDYANVFSRQKHEKVIIEVSSNSSAAFKGKVSRLIRRFILMKADQIVTVSKGSKNDLVDQFKIPPNRIVCIYNTCDINSIRSSATQISNLDIKLPYIVAMGSFRKPKGHWHLIKAFSLFKMKYPQYKLVIIGDGEYKDSYKKLASNLGLSEDSIILPGFLNNPYPIISQSSLFVFSSIYEGFGNAIIEAMACGVPVISSDCKYGPREILAPEMELSNVVNEISFAKNGCIVPHFGDEDIDCSNSISEKEEKLYQAMMTVVQDKKLSSSMVENGFARCLAFDNKVICDNWEAVIE